MQLIRMVDGIEFDVVWNGGPLLEDRMERCTLLVTMDKAPGVGWGRVTRERAPRKRHKPYLRGGSSYDSRHDRSEA
jgi:hypothetical protein